MRLISDDALAIVTIWQESRDQPYAGRVAVGEVIRNRIKARFFSDGSVAGTVCRRAQFSGWNQDDPNRIPSLKIDNNDRIVLDCARAWAESEFSNYSKGAVFYLNPAFVKQRYGSLPPFWEIDADALSEIVIGDHAFRRKR